MYSIADALPTYPVPYPGTGVSTFAIVGDRA